MSVLLGLLFGFLHGLRHAFEPDHVVAVSTVISHQRTARTRIGYAAAWGVGHAATLFLVGALLMLFRAALSPRVDALFELTVAMMLIGLGGRAVRRAAFEARPGALAAHSHSHAEPGGVRLMGPMAMGMVHGLAGSGALTALVVARLPSPGLGLMFILLFGAGATFGMALLAGVAGIPLAQLLRRRWALPALLGATGGVSFVLGLVWLVPAVLRLAAA